jgi:hypothetical protein
VPFFYSLSEEAIAGRGPRLVNPVGAEASWPGDFRFVLGDALLVAPLVGPSPTRDVELPPGARWVDLWHEDEAPYEGGSTVSAWTSPDRVQVPLFVREGAIVPLAVEDDVNGLGTSASRGARTVLVFPGPSGARFTLHDGPSPTTIDAQATQGGATVTLSDVSTTTLLRVRAERAPSSVSADGAPLPARASRAALDAGADGWFYETAKRAAWVKLAQRPGGVTAALAP